MITRTYQYLPPSTKPRYSTVYSDFCSTVQAAENPHATLATLDLARNALAWRGDLLRTRQRRKYSLKRAIDIDEVLDAYDRLVARMLIIGWR
jgi:hypothetical protein